MHWVFQAHLHPHTIPNSMHSVKLFASLFGLPRNTHILYSLGKQKNLRFLRELIKSGNCLIYMKWSTAWVSFFSVVLLTPYKYFPCIYLEINNLHKLFYLAFWSTIRAKWCEIRSTPILSGIIHLFIHSTYSC